MSHTGRIERIFFWLAGASSETLESCPQWERRKYMAFGATVLVPSAFALLASAYAISTLTDNPWVIGPVATVWSLIILTVDRALLAIYRAYQNFFRKVAQFALRIVVAALMGMTISHPMTLLLFRDTIQTAVEKDRDHEIEAERSKVLDQKKLVETKVPAVEAEIAKARDRWNETFSATFLAEDPNAATKKPLTDEEKAAKAALDGKIAEASASQREQLTALEKQISEQEAANKTLGEELNHWQTEFEREINGQRSGISGVGPRAKSIQDDQLAWRRLESKRLAGVLEALTGQRTATLAEIDAIGLRVTGEFNAKAADEASRQKVERDRLDGLKRQVQQQQADQFVEQQNGIRGTLKLQLDAQLAQLKGLHEEISRLSNDGETRIASLRAEPRRDILTQTLALHKLFANGSEGGTFALAAYLVLTALFMLVDTIPLVVKFFSKPGPYDTLLDLDEVRFDRERKSFLASFHRYMDGLANGRMLHLTRNKPLEAALIEGVDRSRAAKEFLEQLMELEKTFEEKVRIERERIANESLPGRAVEKAQMLEDMVSTFYTDLRQRMASFFGDDTAMRMARSGERLSAEA